VHARTVEFGAVGRDEPTLGAHSLLAVDEDAAMSGPQMFL
jgi:hypothetical protein